MEKNGVRLSGQPAASPAIGEQLLPPPLAPRPVRSRVEGEWSHFYTARELAQILRVTGNTIYRLPSTVWRRERKTA